MLIKTTNTAIKWIDNDQLSISIDDDVIVM